MSRESGMMDLAGLVERLGLVSDDVVREAEAALTAQAAEIERLRAYAGRLFEEHMPMIARARNAEAEIEALRKQVMALAGALTPSAETKAAYMGEFSVPLPDMDEDGNEVMRRINVPWVTIKEIMSAIRTLAALPAELAGMVPEWETMESAPRDGTPIQVQIPGHGADNVIAWGDGLVGDDGEPCGNWNYVGDGEPPECWTDGICWAKNEDGLPSVLPVRWKPLAAQEPKP